MRFAVGVRRALTVAAAAFLGLLLVANIYLISARLIFGESLPKVFGYAALAVVSGSMEPAIGIGDLLVIKEQQAYGVGDVVTYNSGRSVVTHRIVELDGANAVVKGDANNVADGSIPLDSIEGKVVFRVPKVGDLMVLARTPAGAILLVAAAVLIFASILGAKGSPAEGGGRRQ